MTEALQHSMLGSLTASEVVTALYQYYQDREYWICFDELRIGTGYGKDAEQRLDFWAMAAIPSQNFRRVAYEIKVSRADFLKEVRKPIKRRRALMLSNEFYFITPPGLIAIEELPADAGLIEIAEVFLGRYQFDTKCPAPWRDSMPPSWQFLAAVARRAARSLAASQPGSAGGVLP